MLVSPLVRFIEITLCNALHRTIRCLAWCLRVHAVSFPQYPFRVVFVQASMQASA